MDIVHALNRAAEAMENYTDALKEMQALENEIYGDLHDPSVPAELRTVARYIINLNKMMVTFPQGNDQDEQINEFKNAIQDIERLLP